MHALFDFAHRDTDSVFALCLVENCVLSASVRICAPSHLSLVRPPIELLAFVLSFPWQAVLRLLVNVSEKHHRISRKYCIELVGLVVRTYELY